MSVTCQDCGIPLPVDGSGYTPCTCADDAARQRRLIVTLGELATQPAGWAYANRAGFRVEWDHQQFRVTDSEGSDRRFEHPAQALIYSKDRLLELGGPGQTWALLVCLDCHTATPDPDWPAPPHWPPLPGDGFRCHVTGRFAQRTRACREGAWAADIEQARRIFATIPHRDECPCWGCETAGPPCDKSCVKCYPDQPRLERAARRRRHSAVPALARRDDWRRS